MSQPRSSGKGATVSTPSTSSCHSSSGESAPPKRQFTATIAIGSRSASSCSCSRVRVLCRSAVTHLRYSRSFPSFAVMTYRTPG
ncbi:hypothetical protein SGLAM104S_03887 [Streptomyces glaucescens]